VTEVDSSAQSERQQVIQLLGFFINLVAGTRNQDTDIR
jgi:hypothetical protein